jgi:hypothetical protein
MYVDVTGEVYTSLRTGTSRFYNLFEYSSVAHNEYTRNSGHANNFWTIGWGFGTRFGMNGRFTTNLDFVWQSIGSKQERMEYPEGPEWDDDLAISDSPPSGTTTENNSWEDRAPELALPIINININMTSNDYYKLRLGGSYRPLSFLAISGGVSLNAIFDSFSETVTHEPSGNFYRDWDFGNTTMRFWPSIYTGVTVGRVRH